MLVESDEKAIEETIEYKWQTEVSKVVREFLGADGFTKFRADILEVAVRARAKARGCSPKWHQALVALRTSVVSVGRSWRG